jgi:hypothetical protein
MRRRPSIEEHHSAEATFPLGRRPAPRISRAAPAALIYSTKLQTLTQGVIDSRIAERSQFSPIVGSLTFGGT